MTKGGAEGGGGGGGPVNLWFGARGFLSKNKVDKMCRSNRNPRAVKINV